VACVHLDDISSSIIDQSSIIRISPLISNKIELGGDFCFLTVVSQNHILLNASGAIYWATDDPARLNHEEELIRAVSVPLSVNERKFSVLSADSQDRASEALSKHGICIIKGLFSPDYVIEWGRAALADLELAMLKLNSRGIDINRPGEGCFIYIPYHSSLAY
jgi:hypothetical protein